MSTNSSNKLIVTWVKEVNDSLSVWEFKHMNDAMTQIFDLYLKIISEKNQNSDEKVGDDEMNFENLSGKDIDEHPEK